MQEWYTWGGKGVLFREVSSVQGCPHRERGSSVWKLNNFYTNTLSLPHTAQWSETVCGWVSLSKPQHSPQLTGSKNISHN